MVLTLNTELSQLIHVAVRAIHSHRYLCRDSYVKCSNVVECIILVCVLCQPVPPSSHASVYMVDHNTTLVYGHYTCACMAIVIVCLHAAVNMHFQFFCAKRIIRIHEKLQ